MNMVQAIPSLEKNYTIFGITLSQFFDADEERPCQTISLSLTGMRMLVISYILVLEYRPSADSICKLFVCSF